MDRCNYLEKETLFFLLCEGNPVTFSTIISYIFFFTSSRTVSVALVADVVHAVAVTSLIAMISVPASNTSSITCSCQFMTTSHFATRRRGTCCRAVLVTAFSKFSKGTFCMLTCTYIGIDMHNCTLILPDV